MIEAIIFDMDGVLIDSTKYIWESFNVLLSEYGVNIPDEKIKKYMGRSMRDQIEMWKGDYGIPHLDYHEFSEKAWKIELELMKRDIKTSGPLYDLIEDVKSKGIKLAVATSSTRSRAEKLLDLINVREYLDVLVTCDDVTYHKPHPEIFLKAAEELGVKPGYCVVFEDAKNGIKAAISAGMKSVGKLTYFHSEDELSASNMTINDFSEITIQDLEKI
jgi:beta-phosphoglucomutase